MYKLLLAEDETAAREGILEGIHWERLNISSVEAAKNGVLALQIAREFRPDILLTDIKMPRMDGMDLAKAVKDINPNCSILIISGYAEVEYLKSAIRLQVVDFVEKPVDLATLEQKIRDAVAVQNEMREKVRLQKTELASLLQGSCFSADRARKILYSVFPELDCAEVFCRSFLVRFLSQDCCEVPEADLAHYQREIEDRAGPQTVITGVWDHFIQMTQFGGRKLSDDAEDILTELQKEFPDEKIFMGVGEIVPLEKQGLSFATARRTLGLMFYDREQTLWGAKDLSYISEKQCVDFRLSDFNMLVSEGRQGEMRRFIQDLTERIRELKPSPRYVSSLYFQMFSALVHTGVEDTSTTQTDLVEELSHEYIFLDIMESKLLEEIDCHFKSYCRYNSSGVMEQVLEYVNLNYSQQRLSLNILSRRFYLSEAYLCVKFKQITGKTFSRYLTEYRIEKSLPLLAKKEYKINDIAVQIGFDNGNYFSKIFKKEKGISPKEFRKRFGIQ